MTADELFSELEVAGNKILSKRVLVGCFVNGVWRTFQVKSVDSKNYPDVMIEIPEIRTDEWQPR